MCECAAVFVLGCQEDGIIKLERQPELHSQNTDCPVRNSGDWIDVSKLKSHSFIRSEMSLLLKSGKVQELNSLTGSGNRKAGQISEIPNRGALCEKR